MKFDALIEVAQFLNTHEEQARLEKLQEIHARGEFLLTVWGQFSSGKSKLINNLLGENILPVHRPETTAVLTYIRYTNDGCLEYAEIAGTDGSFKKIAISELEDYFQGNVQKYDIDSVKYINVYVNSPVLKIGLVIVDTPGVNTLLLKHQELAAAAIADSGAIMYVLSGAASAIDLKFIKDISDCKIDIKFVRTHCDKINAAEEDPTNALRDEASVLSGILGKSAEYYPVSNEADSTFFSGISTLQVALEDFSRALSAKLETSLNLRYEDVRQLLIAKTGERISDLESAVGGERQSLETKQQQINERISSFEQLIARKERVLEREYSELKDDVKQSLEVMLESLTNEFSAALSCSNEAAIVVREYETRFKQSVVKIRKFISTALDEYIADSDKDFLLTAGFSVPESFPTYTELTIENDNRLLMLRETLDDTIAKLKQARTEHQTALEASNQPPDEDIIGLDTHIAELEAQLSQIPDEPIMRLSANQPIQPSKVYSDIEKVAETALMFVPEAQVVAMMAKKGAEQRTQNSDEHGEVFDALQNSPMGYALAPTILKNFLKELDEPPVMEIDTEAEAKRLELRRKIESERREAVDRKVQAKHEAGLLKIEADLKKARADAWEREADDVKNQYDREARQLELEAKQKSLQQYKNDYTEFFRRNLNECSQHLYSAYFRSAEQNIAMWTSRRTSDILKRLEQERTALNAALNPESLAELETVLQNHKKCMEVLQ
jgi:GTPase SAR1 family protein